jgi:membrane-associated phospholipid phosphatase
MNAFPPQRLVEESAYRLFAHPIYVGFSVVAFAVAAAAGSPSGFWIVAPIAVLAAVALVLSYEGPDALARFGPRRTRPLLALPPDDDKAASLVMRAVAVVLAWGTWTVVYALLSRMPAAEAARELRFAFELDWPRPAWWIWPYSLAYPFAALCPFVLATNREVRQFVLAVWVGSAVGFAAMLLWPAKAALLAPTSGGGGIILALNRGLDADWLACPSFHVAWAFLAAQVYARRWPLWRVPAYALAVIIAVSSVATGAHASIDVVAGLALAGVAVNHDTILHALVRNCEALANSWRAWRIGPLRVISHAPWTASAAFAGTLGAAMLVV